MLLPSPNPFNILAAGIGNSQPSFSLPHEQPNPPQPIFNIATNLHNLGPTTAFEPSGVTRYCADDIIGEIRSEFAIKCWESIRNKIARTSIHYIPNLAGEVEKILLSIEDIKVDCSSIRRMVTNIEELCIPARTVGDVELLGGCYTVNEGTEGLLSW